ncbi:hypothetical protein [Pseudoxanthomonas sp. X-1]|uniref:hypothetical protein n=1 Tax=Pseudoxanthomonas sp. X-1 TaxID=2571115 RepID=UPI00110AD16A|nr:hypothetical protein [Pseudoxanthomonas sp. X-1]TMN24500.1 hypothetical protein FF950_05310 [Pseudoxanthomonas sp. X-1]UAY75234.1 hypothetical protein LAJ50_02920 [Pseudoxanthomonas sp. X-1]
MTSPIDICNLALGHIRAGRRIAALTENSEEADACGQFYEMARDTALAAYTWQFARRYAAPALVTAPPAGYSQAYRVPDGCLQVIALRGSEELAGQRHHCWTMPPLPIHDFVLAADDGGQLVLTNLSSAVMAYTSRVENPDAWSAPFRQAVGFLLASYISIPITGKEDLAKTNLGFYQDALESAKLHDISQQNQQVQVASGVEARL